MKSKVWTKFVQTSDFTVKALTTLNSLNRRNFQTKIDMKVKIRFYAKLCTQNKILASKMQHLKQQKTSVSVFHLEKVDLGRRDSGEARPCKQHQVPIRWTGPVDRDEGN